MSDRRRLPSLAHAAASLRAPRTRPAARAFLGGRASRVDGARASGHSPWNRDTWAGRLAVAAEILLRGDGSLRRLATRPWAELARVPGVGRAKAARLAVAIELGRRVGAESEPPPER